MSLTMAFFTTPYSMAMATIPAAAVLILLPHQMSVVATGAAKVNLADPRGSLDRAPANTFARRMRCAHFNAIEAFPLISAGILGCVLTRVPHATVDRVARVWLCSRIAYLVFFAVGSSENEGAQYGRVVSYLFSLGSSIYLMVQAARHVGALTN